MIIVEQLFNCQQNIFTFFINLFYNNFEVIKWKNVIAAEEINLILKK